MSVAVKKILGVLLLAISALVFVTYARHKKFYNGPLDPANIVAKRIKSFPSTKLFDEGAYAQIQEKALSQSCTYQDKVQNLLCSQGFYYVKRSKELNKKFNQISEGTLARPVNTELASVADGLGTGVALSFIKRNPTQLEIDNNPKVYTQYLYDGWGYREALSSPEPKPDRICKFEDYNRYCLFGAGRALFYLGLNAKAVETESTWVKKGFYFSKTYEGKDIKHIADENLDKVALALREGNSSSSPALVNCVTEGIRHTVECREI